MKECVTVMGRKRRRRDKQILIGTQNRLLLAPCAVYTEKTKSPFNPILMTVIDRRKMQLYSNYKMDASMDGTRCCWSNMVKGIKSLYCRTWLGKYCIYDLQLQTNREIIQVTTNRGHQRWFLVWEDLYVVRYELKSIVQQQSQVGWNTLCWRLFKR